MKFRTLVVFAVLAVILFAVYTTMQNTSQASNLFPGVSPALIQGTATAQAMDQGIAPDLPASQIPSNCSLFGSSHRYGSYRLPWNFWGYMKGVIHSGTDLGVQLLACSDGPHVLYWDLRHGVQPDYYEVSAVAAAGCWSFQVRNWQVAVGVHDPYLTGGYALIEQRDRSDPFFDAITMTGDSVDISHGCAAS